MSTFTLHTLGCGSAKPSARHNPSSTVLNIREQLYMIDCGEGAQREMQRQRLKFNRLHHIFLTHLHGDHFFGLPGLIGTLGLTDYGGTLCIYTFAEGIRQIRRICDFFCRNLPFNIEYVELDPKGGETIFENKAFTVRTVGLEHRVPCVGYIFEERPKQRHIIREMTDFHKVPVARMSGIKAGEDFVKSDGTVIPNAILTRDADPSLRYAHIGDTAYMPELAAEIGPADLLYHETTYLESEAAVAGQRGHSTAMQAARVARDSGSKALLTGHYSSRYHDDMFFVREAEQIFSPSMLNYEGLRLPLD